ncbi:class I SAM-dependent methyltransferase [Sphingomicrobium sediminis]|uniref:Class I SAM-dependent methyltransferase n=1 Tax=Sphingomicrobium sediminis TaxID=2950949 RepID=A0A9X2J246_9SPHN|nr:class I SAM-dependent methyltransferase [Sphingomicrobium sediminis]MCM8556660.1 class I SAM-dependent methyltransferase [Sphingomicrobium sediminis]
MPARSEIDMSEARAKAARFWDKVAPRYARQPVRDERAYARKLDYISQLLNRHDKLLEIGCGTGSTALILSPHVAAYLATDVSNEMIEIARSKQADSDPCNLTFSCAVAHEIVARDHFDVILASSLLHLIDDVPALLGAVRQQLKPGGLFISKTPCIGETNFLVRMLLPAMELLGIAPRINVFKKIALIEAIETAGFAVEHQLCFDKEMRSPLIVARKPLEKRKESENVPAR